VDLEPATSEEEARALPRMKLALKLALAVMLVIVSVVGVQTAVNVDRVRDRITERFHKTVHARAQTLAPVAAEAWRLSGRARAEALVREADAAFPEDVVSLLDASQATPAPAFALDDAAWAQLRRGEAVTVVGADQLIHAHPFPIDEAEQAVIQIVASLAGREVELQDLFSERVLTALLLVVFASAVVVLITIRVVGRPLKLFAEQARRIGEGDLDARVALAGTDEMGGLAARLNRMAEQLVAARARYEREHDRRLATLAQLRHAERLKILGELAASMAHEMGTPLNVIRGRARMIVRGIAEGEAAVDCAQVVVEQTDRLTGRIRGVLGFARRRSTMDREVDLASVVASSIELLRPLLAKHQVQVEARYDGAVMAAADESQLEQVLANLLINAAQAMPDGGRVEVAVGVERRDPPPDVPGPERTWATISVRDGGIGMAPEVVGRIFEPFFTTKAADRGTGLGLSVSQGIVGAHGGWIEVESAPGRGTRFTVYLPAGAPPGSEQGHGSRDPMSSPGVSEDDAAPEAGS